MKKLALCIGINDYPGTDSDLSGCVNDAEDWAKLLEGRGFTCSLFIDSQATKSAMLEAIRTNVKDLGRGDLFVVTFSGHGTWTADANGDEADFRDEALCPYDLMEVGPVVDDELFDVFSNRVFGSKVVLISDSCHSGTMARFAPAFMATRRVKFIPPEVWLRSAKETRVASLAARAPLRRKRMGALVMAGCQDWEYSYDAVFANRPNGAFTFFAIAALNNLSNQTYSAWQKAIRVSLPSVEYPQTPNLDGSWDYKSWPLFG